MQPRKKGIIIARVSTPRQEREGLSLDRIQLPRMREYAKVNKIDIEEKHEFRFQETADSKIRKKFEEIISLLKKRKDISVIISFRVDRVTRNYRDAVIFDQLRLEHDKELHFVDDRIVLTKDSVGKVIQDWDLKVFLAKQAINRLQEDAHNTRFSKLEKGELPGKAPFGYENVKIKKGGREISEVEVVPFEAKVVQHIYKWYASDSFSMSEVMDKIKDEFELEFGKSTVERILKDKFYHGIIVHNKTKPPEEHVEYEHYYEKIIHPDLYDKVQAVLKKRTKTKHKNKGIPRLYRGILTCAKCGYAISPEPHPKKLKSGEVNNHVYYQCTEYGGKHGAKMVSEVKLTQQFSKIFQSMELPDEYVKDLTSLLKEAHRDKSYFKNLELKKLRSEYDKLENRKDGAYEDKLDGRITADDYDGYIKKWNDRQAEIENKMQRLGVADAEFYMTATYLLELSQRAQELFLKGDMHQKRQLIKLVLPNVTLGDGKLLYTLEKPFDTILFYADRPTKLPG